jgi:hypothetical protein
MTDMRTKRSEEPAGKKRPRIAKLELSRQTLRDLTDDEQDPTRGGVAVSINSGPDANWCSIPACARVV